MVNLKNVTIDTLQEFNKLSVQLSQNKFVSSSAISLEEAYIHNSGDLIKALVKAIYLDREMIGHVLILYTSKGKDSYYDLRRFMIDMRYQGLGYGKSAFELVMNYIKTTPLGEANKVILEYMPTNHVASHIYHTYGFVDTDQYNQFGEVKAELRL